MEIVVLFAVTAALIFICAISTVLARISLNHGKYDIWEGITCIQLLTGFMGMMFSIPLGGAMTAASVLVFAADIVIWLEIV